MQHSDEDTAPAPAPLLNALRWLLVALTALLMLGSLVDFGASAASHDLGDSGYDTGLSTFIVTSVKPAMRELTEALRLELKLARG